MSTCKDEELASKVSLISVDHLLLAFPRAGVVQEMAACLSCVVAVLRHVVLGFTPLNTSLLGDEKGCL